MLSVAALLWVFSRASREKRTPWDLLRVPLPLFYLAAIFVPVFETIFEVSGALLVHSYVVHPACPRRTVVHASAASVWVSSDRTCTSLRGQR